MLGLLITLAFALAVAGLARLALRRFSVGLDPAARFGIEGLAGLGAVGWITLFVGLIPGGLRWGVVVPAVLAVAGVAAWVVEFRREPIKAKVPAGTEWLWFAGLAVPALFALVGVLAPSDTYDWDSLAYHLAVPKLWLEAGRIEYIPFIHHSNFPFAVDNLYIWGLTWGGEQGAKAFSLAFFAFGLAAVFGLGRQLYGRPAGMWASVGLATIPVVMWEAGTGYIDLAHGLFAGLGAALVVLGLSDRPDDKAHKGWVVLGAILLGFAVGSKYTGLQAVAAVCAVVAAAGLATKQIGAGFKGAVLVGSVACAIGSPWYIKNVLWTGNPVFPFFYEKLGGRNWDQRRADIYRNEQETFGVGRDGRKLNPLSVGHAVLGLAYQPGRFINPDQQHGQGFPQGAVGVAILCGALAWMFSGKGRRFEGLVLAFVGVSFLMWFALSQQSRYVLSLAAPLGLLLGGGVVRLRAGPVLAAIVALQGVYSVLLIRSEVVDREVPVVLGAETPEDYLAKRVQFFRPSRDIDDVAKNGKVALYDEVFGFLLDVPYFWANPGHCTIIPYDDLQDGRQYADEMRRLGFTHVYVNLSAFAPQDAPDWIAAAGLGGPPRPYPAERRQAIAGDWQIKWRVLIAEAVAAGELRVVKAYGRNGAIGSLLLEIGPRTGAPPGETTK